MVMTGVCLAVSLVTGLFGNIGSNSSTFFSKIVCSYAIQRCQFLALVVFCNHNKDILLLATFQTEGK